MEIQQQKSNISRIDMQIDCPFESIRRPVGKLLLIHCGEWFSFRSTTSFICILGFYIGIFVDQDIPHVVSF
jgi:hypothetical protein